MENLDLQRQSKPMFRLLRNSKGEANLVPEPTPEPTPEAAPEAIPEPVPEVPLPNPEPGVGVSWKEGLQSDLRESALVKKFGDDIDGLNKFAKSHNNLEQMLGQDKVPIPKGPDDVEGWSRFSKAMGIPDKAEEYGLADANLPESMKAFAVDKSRFAEIAHALKLTPSQTEGLWKTYNEINVDSYNKALETQENSIKDMVSGLKGEWGDAYDVNIELGQLVINKFASDQEANDYLTAALTKDPRAIKFLAKIGEQFAENKVGEFQIKQWSTTPEEAQNEIDKMVNDLQGPYMNQQNTFTEREHQAAMDRVNYLRASIIRARGQV